MTRLQQRDIRPIHFVHEGYEFALNFDFELISLSQELTHDAGILLRLQAAGAINQSALRQQQFRRLAEQFQL